MNDLNEIKNITKKITLSSREKESAKANILNFIRLHPVSKPDTSRLLSKWSFFSLFNLNSKPMPAFLGILLVLASSGGISFAAEGALPGDLLYPVKVGINEEVRAAVSFSAEAKANWDARRLERRLEEAEELAHKKEFSAEVRSKIEENFEAHAERVERRIADFESKGEVQSAADLSSNFETSLSAHEKILFKIDGEEVSKFLPKIRAKKGSASLLRIKMESRVSEEPKPEAKEAAEGKMKVSENKIEEVKSFIENVRAKLGAEATVDAEAKLTEAQKVWTDGKIKFDAGEYGEAFVLFQRAHRIAQEAKLLIEAKSEFNIDFKTQEKEQGEGKNSENKEKENGRFKEEKANIDINNNANSNVEINSKSEVNADDEKIKKRDSGNINTRLDLGL